MKKSSPSSSSPRLAQIASAKSVARTWKRVLRELIDSDFVPTRELNPLPPYPLRRIIE